MSTTKSPVDICNMALSLIGDGGRISGFDDGSAEAEVCDLEFDDALLEVLEEHTWARARKFATLTPESETPEHTYTSFYVLPPDFVQIQNVNGRKLLDDVTTAIDSAGRLCLATNDAGPLELVYTGRIGINLFTTGMIGALRKLLASRFALSLRKNVSMSDKLARDYELALGKAIFRDGKETTAEDVQSTFDLKTAHDSVFTDD